MRSLDGSNTSQLAALGLVLALFGLLLSLAAVVTGRVTVVAAAATAAVAVLWWQLVPLVPGAWAVAGGNGALDAPLDPQHNGQVTFVQVAGVAAWLLYRGSRAASTAPKTPAPMDTALALRRIQSVQEVAKLPVPVRPRPDRPP